GIRQRLQRLGPVCGDRPALGRRTSPAVPAYLLHVIVELDAVAIRIEREGGIIDTGVQLRRDRIDEGYAVLLQKVDRGAQLGKAADLDPERHAGSVLREP